MEPTEQQPTGQEPASTSSTVENPKVLNEWAVSPVHRSQLDLLIGLDIRTRQIEDDFKNLVETVDRTLLGLRDLSDQVRAKDGGK
jgi:hypothetical protein